MTKKAYFPILDALRFAASMCVFLAHSTAFFKPGEVYGMKFPDSIRNAGFYGVVFFYVLSGFLITYLLLAEKENNGRIDMRKFYMRRILRIWPLYYLIIVLSFFILYYLSPWKGYWPTDGSYPTTELLLYLLFLPNIASYAGPGIVTCFQTYTIGYEEQFYLFWPWIMRIGKRYLLPLLLVLFFGYIILELIHLELIRHTPGQHGGVAGLIKICLSLINKSNMSAFVAGAFASVAYLRGAPGLLRSLRWRGLSYVLSCAILCFMYFVKPEGVGLVNIVSLLYACLILHLVLRPEVTAKWQTRFQKGGRISYGIYMFHPTILVFVSACLQKAPIADMRWFYLLYLVLSFGLLIIVANLSYRWVELPFLKKKRAFSSL